MANYSILTSLPIYIASISDALDINVTFGGTDAYCMPQGNQWRINLPLFDVNNAEACALAYAYALHETGHVEFSEFSVLTNMIKDIKNKADLPLKRNLNNLFEDTFVERKLSIRFSGAYSRLSKMRTWMNDKNTKSQPSFDDVNIKTNILSYIYCASFMFSNSYNCYKKDTVTLRDIIAQKIDDKFIDGLDLILKDTALIQCSQDSADLTDRIFDYINDVKDSLEQSQQDDDGQSQQGDDGQSQHGDDGQSQHGDNSQQGTSKERKEIISALNDIATGNASLNERDAGEQLSKALNEQSKDDIASGKVNPSDYTKDSKINNNIEYRKLAGNTFHAKALKDQADHQSVFVRQRLQSLIAAKQRKFVSRKSNGKRAIRNASTKMATGDYKVFRQELTRKLTNTAITIVLDDSGSMRGERGQIAAVATQAIIKALEPVNFVETSVEAFGSTSSHNTIYTVKAFNETSNTCAERLSAHLRQNGGYTPLLNGLWSGLRGISQRKEQRKILIVITDGQPDNNSECVKLISRIRKSQGVEVFGIGIGDATHLVKPLFGDKYAIGINRIDELPIELFKLSEQILFN